MNATDARSSGVAAARARLQLEPSTAVRGAVILGLFLFAVLGLPSLVGGDWVTTFSSVSIYSIVALGFGILYGRVGMISLGQVALLSVGCWIGARLAYATSLPFPVLLLITGAITCVIGVLVGLPSLRLSGLYLALITLMFAGAVTVVLGVIDFPNGGHGFKGTSISNTLTTSNPPVRRPSMAVGDTAFYRYIVVVAALMFLLALVHVSAKPGRAWASIRESEPAALAAGVNITLYKMWAFALASFMTGVAGCLLAAQVGDAPRDHVPDAGLPHAGGDGAHRRHLQPVGRDRRGRLQPAPALPLPGAVEDQLELPPHSLRRRASPGAPHRAGRPRRAVPQGHGEPRTAARPPRPVADRGKGHGVIEVSGLTVRFAGVTPIDDMNVVFPGGTCGLIGPNGAGKTTFFNVLSGFVKPAAGSVAAFGEDLLKMADFRRARWGLRRTFQTEMAIEKLSVFDNVAMIHEHSGAKRSSRRADVQAAIDFVGLDGFAAS